MSVFDFVQFDNHSIQVSQRFKELFENLEFLVYSEINSHRHREILMIKLEETFTWANKAIRADQISRETVVKK